MLKIPEDFPKSPPKGYFLTKIFHPNISDKGDICVNSLKKDWDPMNWSIRHILRVVHCLLINPFPESALNEEAGKLFMENYDQYFRRAKIFTEIHAVQKGAAAKLLKKTDNAMDEVRLLYSRRTSRTLKKTQASTACWSRTRPTRSSETSHRTRSRTKPLPPRSSPQTSRSQRKTRRRPR